MTTSDILQILIKGQNELKEELMILMNETKQDLALLREETKEGFRKTHERLDKQGKQLAYVEDDAPTREEHTDLVKRVEKVEQVLSS